MGKPAVVKVFKTDKYPHDSLPEFATSGSAGRDLPSAEHVVIPSGGSAMVDTGLVFAIEPGYEVQVRPRSGLAARHSISVVNTPGTVDSDYRGPIKVILINHGHKAFEINPGDRIAQMVVARVPESILVEVESEADLGHTGRGTSGFGSSGVSQPISHSGGPDLNDLENVAG